MRRGTLPWNPPLIAAINLAAAAARARAGEEVCAEMQGALVSSLMLHAAEGECFVDLLRAMVGEGNSPVDVCCYYVLLLMFYLL